MGPITTSTVASVDCSLQDVSGFTDELPTWVPPAISITFTPFLAARVVLVGLHNSGRLQAALDETLAARTRLVAPPTASAGTAVGAGTTVIGTVTVTVLSKLSY